MSLSYSQSPGSRHAPMDHDADEAKSKTRTLDIDPDKLWYIHGRAYDLAEFISNHPGGTDAIVLGRGRDATALFESYHPFTDKPKDVLKKYLVTDLPASLLSKYVVDTSYNKWFYRSDGEYDPFWKTLKEKCGKHVKDNKISRTADLQVLAFLLVMGPIQLYGYLGYMRGDCLQALLLGFVSWWLFLVGHDSGHFASFRNPFLNKIIFLWTFAGIGNPYIWDNQHNYGHHCYTNDHDLDPDTRNFAEMLRTHKKNPFRPLHRLIMYKWFLIFMWLFTVVGEAILVPIRVFLTGVIQSTTKMNDRSWGYKLGMRTHWLVYSFLILIVPWLQSRTNPVLLYLCYACPAGLCFALSTQGNHVTLQTVTAAEKAQHHLFPGISHFHLHHLTPIIKEVCEEFGVGYMDHPTIIGALQDVFSYYPRLAFDTKEA